MQLFVYYLFNKQLITMKALHIKKYGRFPVLTDCPIPKRGDSSQILAKVHYAPINPSDLNFYQGKYGIRKDGFPIVGFEGSGVVLQTQNNDLIGKKLSFLADSTNGTHATHIKTTLNNCIIWPDSYQLTQISTSWINPFSCIGLCQIIEQQNPQNVLLSGATSQLCSMIIRHIASKWPSLNTIGLSRSKDKQQILIQKGLKKFIQVDSNLHGQLSKIQGKTVFLDCVGGQFCGEIFNILPKNSIMVSYGRLSGEPLGKVNLGSLYYENKVIRGFWLNTWLSQQSDKSFSDIKSQVVLDFNQFYSTTIRKIYKLENFMDGYRESIKNQSEGKILLDMN